MRPVASGHGCIRVRFQKGYEGAVFLADTTPRATRANDTGNPIIDSGMLLRESLVDAAARPVSPEPLDENSIIAVKGSGPVENGNDGVVSYESALNDGVESEVVVCSAHSTHDEPATIEEVRRILLLSTRAREASACR